ncbi:LysR family transcriptional regulator [Xylanimonas ulmi]|uniref:Regulatory helix-turn-helix LysR family protein n=1 Tax=Xylanimonas ulmi TaxID=228973 RepID=A0A4Q7M1N5_9MICO|nr:regulatory helix-turn-helix LysR family protein [Xylanibacterium ulmi]
MELRQLRYFAGLAATLHFSRAAHQLHITQPALSQAIRQLESQMGARLLDRTTRQVSLTPAGLRLAHDAERILAAVAASETAVRAIAASCPAAGPATRPGPE